MVSLHLATRCLGIKLNPRPRMIAGMMIHDILNATNCAVIVVPILAPKIKPIAWARVSNPALIKPMTITVLALDDWITQVTSAPEIIATKRLEENIRRMVRILSPATRCRPSLIIFMPKINIASPPKTCSIVFNKFIKFLFGG